MRGASLFLRLALGAGFLSAVADRFGLWGAPGAEGVAWGTFSRFLDYAALLNPWFPEAWIPAVGWGVTVLETALGLALVAGVRTREAAFAAGLLLLAFGLGMTAGTGVKSALDASVFAAAGGALVLCRAVERDGPHPISVDALLGPGSPASRDGSSGGLP